MRCSVRDVSARSRCSASWSARRRWPRSEEHTSELQSQSNLVCRLLLEKKKMRLRVVVSEQVKDPLNQQMFDLFFDQPSRVCRLPACCWIRDDDLSQLQHTFRRRELFALSQRKGEHVGRRVLACILPVQLANGLIVCNENTQLGGRQTLALHCCARHAFEPLAVNRRPERLLDGNKNRVHFPDNRASSRERLPPIRTRPAAVRDTSRLPPAPRRQPSSPVPDTGSAGTPRRWLALACTSSAQR